jgi:hypothetical protein
MLIQASTGRELFSLIVGLLIFFLVKNGDCVLWGAKK